MNNQSCRAGYHAWWSNQSSSQRQQRREHKDRSNCIGSWPVSNDVGNTVVSCLNSLIESLNSSSEVCYITSKSSNVGINVRNRVATDVAISLDDIKTEIRCFTLLSTAVMDDEGFQLLQLLLDNTLAIKSDI